MMTSQEEPWTVALPEMQRMFNEHYDELSLHARHGFPLAIDLMQYFHMEAMGQLLVVTLRQDGVLVGYFVGFVRPGLHYQTCLTLTMDVFFIAPEVRNQSVGALRLFRKVEAAAKARGVDLLMYGSKKHKPAGRLFEALGFAPAESWHYKFLREGGA